MLLMAVGGLFVTSVTQAQNYKRRVIQLSGIVLGEDSVSGLPGVHVYVPKAGRGTSTNVTGFFSMPVLPGDSVVIAFPEAGVYGVICSIHPTMKLTVDVVVEKAAE